MGNRLARPDPQGINGLKWTIAQQVAPLLTNEKIRESRVVSLAALQLCYIRLSAVFFPAGTVSYQLALCF